MVESKVKLHLGCGNRYIPGFMHVDAIKFDHVDLVESVDHLPVFSDNSIDLIYACHLLEHFNKKRIPEVLKEWRRILKKKGVLRLSVPDFKVLSELYVSGRATLSQIHGPIIGGQTYLYNFHYSLFDKDTLTTELIKIGFAKESIREWNWRETEHCNVDDFSQAYLPHMDKENGTLISLNIEAVK